MKILILLKQALTTRQALELDNKAVTLPNQLHRIWSSSKHSHEQKDISKVLSWILSEKPDIVICQGAASDTKSVHNLCQIRGFRFILAKPQGLEKNGTSVLVFKEEKNK